MFLSILSKCETTTTTKSYVDRFPEPGETLSGNGFRKGFGGKAANACVMAARLGVECRMLAKVDLFFSCIIK